MADGEIVLQFIQHYYSFIREALEKHENSLRFNAPFLTVSEISKQYYCGKKVEMGRVLGKILTGRKVTCQEAHEILLRMLLKLSGRRLLGRFSQVSLCLFVKCFF